MEFRDKCVLVTGGAQGIGKAISIAYVKKGARVFIADSDREAGEETAKYITDMGFQSSFIKTDISQETEVKALIDNIIEESGKIDILINNAGIGNTKSILKRDMDEWNRVIAVNLTGPYMCVKYSLPYMQGGSSIVNISSTRALMSEENTEPYSASKGGILALTHSLAVSLGKRGIRVNTISPGWIDVSNWKKKSTREQEILRDIDHSQHPVGRVGVPMDIAEACLFLTDNDKSGFITGTNLIVDGGMTIKMIYEEDVYE